MAPDSRFRKYNIQIDMKKKHIIILLIAGCIIISMILQFLEMNLTLRTILVTVLMALLFFIRAVLSIQEDKVE